jgi:hypothetical protein
LHFYFQAESAIKREEKRSKSFKPPKEETAKSEDVSKKAKKSDLNLDALKAKVKAASAGKKGQK